MDKLETSRLVKKTKPIFQEAFTRAKRIGTPEDEAIEKGLEAAFGEKRQEDRAM